MLTERFLLCKGALVQAVCRCGTLQGQYSRLRFSLRGVPLPCVVMAGNGRRYYYTTLDADTAEWQTPPLYTDDLWIALCRPTGEVLCWGAASGLWSEEMGFAVCERFEPPERPNAPKQEAVEQVEQAPREAAPDQPVEPPKNDEPIVENSNEPVEENGNVPIEATSDAIPQDSQATVQETDAEDDLAIVPPSYREAFRYGTPCEALQQQLPGSRFVVVQQEELAYVMGLLYDSEHRPTHFCYGVPGERDRPLQEGEWVEIEGDRGYWLIYTPLQ